MDFERDNQIYKNIEIIDAGSEGKALARIGQMVVFVPYAIPGDIIDLKIIKKKKNFAEAKIIEIITPSKHRIEAPCEHFGICGGCKWQAMSYEKQLHYKQKQVSDNLERIGKIEPKTIFPILPSKTHYYYRNKLEFTFSNRRWLLNNEMLNNNLIINNNALGFHIPLLFDRVLDIDNCLLQKKPSNEIRNHLKKYAIDNRLSFYDAKKQTGFLRNLIIRTSSANETMVILIVKEKNEKDLFKLLDNLYFSFPEITSLQYVINPKNNDTINDLDVHLYRGNSTIYEKMMSFSNNKELNFTIGPKSFYQTNSLQAANLYKIAADFAQFQKTDIVYDLYTGTGTIANFIADNVSKVVGIDYIQEAIEDAYKNSIANNISNTNFYSGDIVKVLNNEFVNINGTPNVIITDPPRAGMHEKVIRQILEIKPERIVYISCNPATQSRDAEILNSIYNVEKSQAVDMFPQTHHVENVLLLIKK